MIHTQAKCQYFGTCGGCSLQHLDYEEQVRQKESQLKDAFGQFADLEPDTYLKPLTGSPWNYRNRANLSVRHVTKKGGVLVGFREKRNTFVADMESCEILPYKVSTLLPAFRELIGKLSLYNRIPQIHVAHADGSCGFVLRHLDVFTDEDLGHLSAFEKEQGIQFYLQPKGPDSIHPLNPATPLTREYLLAGQDLTFNFSPGEFTQINSEINEKMVNLVVDLLEPKSGETIGDLFCGIGNLSLPIAKKGARVIGWEGSETQVRTARENAERNKLDHLTEFETVDLYEFGEERSQAISSWDKLVLDPPRSGAEKIIQGLSETNPGRIVYVSCNPKTLARDAQMLVQNKGYQFRAAGLIDMFPHTSHLETIALFNKPSHLSPPCDPIPFSPLP